MFTTPGVETRPFNSVLRAELQPVLPIRLGHDLETMEGPVLRAGEVFAAQYWGNGRVKLTPVISTVSVPYTVAAGTVLGAELLLPLASEETDSDPSPQSAIDKRVDSLSHAIADLYGIGIGSISDAELTRLRVMLDGLVQNVGDLSTQRRMDASDAGRRL